jgi:transposase
VEKKRRKRYPIEFRRMAVERLQRCENIVALAKELGIHRQLLYRWREQLAPADIGDVPRAENSREVTLRKEVNQLKRVLAEKTVELDFFKGALQKVEARRQKKGISGETAFQVVDIDDTFLDGALQNAAKCEKRDPTAKPFLIETLLASHTSKSLLQPLNLLRGHELNFPHVRLLCPFRVYVSIETASER